MQNYRGELTGTGFCMDARDFIVRCNGRDDHIAFDLFVREPGCEHYKVEGVARKHTQGKFANKFVAVVEYDYLGDKILDTLIFELQHAGGTLIVDGEWEHDAGTYEFDGELTPAGRPQ